MDEPQAKTLAGMVALAGNGQFSVSAHSAPDDAMRWVVDVYPAGQFGRVLRTLHSPADFDAWRAEVLAASQKE